MPPGRFLLLRAVRLYPAFWFAVLLTVAGRFAGLGDMPTKWDRVGYGLLLLPTRSPDCFVLGVEWSLVFEVIFYLVFGCLAFCGRRAITVGTVVWLSVCLAKLAINPQTDAIPLPGWRGIMFSPFNLYFLAGVITYQLRDRGRRLRSWMPLAFPLLLAAPGVCPNYLCIHLTRVIGFALLVWHTAGSKRWHADDALVRYGDITYGIYLIHAPVITFFEIRGLWLLRSMPSDRIVIFAACFALAVGSAYGLIESAAYRMMRRWIVGERRSTPAIETEDRRVAA
jgi:peptidoglycan/LPS O-acetylase OafA/YrhL